LAVRRFAASRRGRKLYRRASNVPPSGPFGQMVKGLSVSLRSYSRPVRAPRGSHLLTVDPAIAWWDFHKSPQAIAAGERAMDDLLMSIDPASAAGVIAR